MATCNDMSGAPLVQNQNDLFRGMAQLPSVLNHPPKPMPGARNPALITYQILPARRYEVREEPGSYDAQSEEAGKNSLDVNELSLKLVRFADELNRVTSLHQFHYQGITALLKGGECELQENSVHGLRATLTWLVERDQALVKSLDEIRGLVRKSVDG